MSSLICNENILDKSDQNTANNELCKACGEINCDGENEPFWIQCDSCLSWFHCKCLNIPKTSIPKEDEHWFCHKCSIIPTEISNSGTEPFHGFTKFDLEEAVLQLNKKTSSFAQNLNITCIQSSLKYNYMNTLDDKLSTETIGLSAKSIQEMPLKISAAPSVVTTENNDIRTKHKISSILDSPIDDSSPSSYIYETPVKLPCMFDTDSPVVSPIAKDSSLTYDSSQSDILCDNLVPVTSNPDTILMNISISSIESENTILSSQDLIVPPILNPRNMNSISSTSPAMPQNLSVDDSSTFSHSFPTNLSFKCTHCNKSFSSLHGLNIHLSRIHPPSSNPMDNTQQSSNPNIIEHSNDVPNSQINPDNRPREQCPHCMGLYIAGSGLTIHINSAHPSEARKKIVQKYPNTALPIDIDNSLSHPNLSDIQSQLANLCNDFDAMLSSNLDENLLQEKCQDRSNKAQ